MLSYNKRDYKTMNDYNQECGDGQGQLMELLDDACLTRERLQRRSTSAAYAMVQRRLRRRRQWRAARRAGAVAACLLILFLSGAVAFLSNKNGASAGATQYITVQASAGMRTNMRLPDGTEVYLNSGSRLVYPQPFAASERRVELSGEAYFKVTGNAKQPFRIALPDFPVEAEVVGTEFNIRAYKGDDALTVTLVTGGLNLNDVAEKRLLAALKPSERVCYEPAKDILNTKVVDTRYETSWMDGKLMFKDTPMPEVLLKMSHYYNVTFEVRDEAINRYVFTGVFDNRLLSQALYYLALSSDISYSVNEPGIEGEQQRTKVILRKNK